jgi:GAF domain-containing protein
MAIADARIAPAHAWRTDTLELIDARDVCRELATSIACRLDLPDVVVYLRSDDRLHFRQVAAIGAKCDAGGSLLAPLVVRAGESIVGLAADSARLVRVDDLDREPRYLVDDACRRSELCVPIVHRREVLGVIDSEHPRAAYFDDAHCAAFSLAAELVAPRLARLMRAAPSASHSAVRRESNGSDRESRLSREAFDRAVVAALRHFHDVRRLRESPLVRSACIDAASREGDDTVLALRSLVLDAIERVAQLPGAADQARLLRRRFVDRCASQSLLAEALHLGESTLRRHVQRATTLLASVLWRQEAIATNASSPSRGEVDEPRAARPVAIAHSIQASPVTRDERADRS